MNIVREEKLKQVEIAFYKLLRHGRAKNVFFYRRISASQRTKLLVKMRIGKESDVNNEIAVGWGAKLETE